MARAMADWGKGCYISMAKYQRYRAFGTEDVSWASLNQAYRYTGKPVDEEKGIDQQYFGARYYQSSLGRWLAVDPLHADYPSLSPYVYCANNPLNFNDIDGNYIVQSQMMWTTNIYGYSLYQRIYYPNWRTWADKAFLNFIPFAGFLDVQNENLIIEGLEATYDIVGYTKPSMLKWLGTIGHNLIKMAFLGSSIYHFITDYTDPQAVVDEYERIETREGRCYSESCVHDRIMRAIIKVEKRNKKPNEEDASDGGDQQGENTGSDKTEAVTPINPGFSEGWEAEHGNAPNY